MKLTAYIDGSCYGNPGESGFGVVLQDAQGEMIASMGGYIGRGTNNMAEYRGLLGAVDLAASFHATEIRVFSDSELLVKQMQGIYRVKQPHLIELRDQIREALNKTGLHLDMQHIPRSKNKIADKLARKAVQMKADVTL